MSKEKKEQAQAPKQVRIVLSRRIHLTRPEKDDVRLESGVNVVDADVAEHAFVKAHTIAEATEHAQQADAALQARIAELESHVAELTKKNGEQAAMLEAYEAAAKAAK